MYERLHHPLYCCFILLLLSYTRVSRAWELVKHFRITNGETVSESCRRVCVTEPLCVEYRVVENQQSALMADCYLLSEKMVQQVTSKLPHILNQHRSAETVVANRTDVDVRRLLKGPVAVDSTMMMNHASHFARGCSYTITAWVWLYKQKHMPHTEQVIFTTRELPPYSDTPEENDSRAPFLPAIVFNVGGLPERENKFFFSGGRDSGGYYSGFWTTQPVRFNEWMHVALVMSEQNTLHAFINGEEAGSVLMSLQEPRRGHAKNSISLDETCIYNTNPNSLHTAINNSVIQIMGNRVGRLRSTLGMVQDVVVVRNKALRHFEIQQVMAIRPPASFPTLTKLMNSLGMYTLDSYCTNNYLNNYYLFLEWGLCPESVCGAVCLSEAFLLGRVGSLSSLASSSSSSSSSSASYFQEEAFLSEEQLEDVYAQLDDLYADEYSEMMYEAYYGDGDPYGYGYYEDEYGDYDDYYRHEGDFRSTYEKAKKTQELQQAAQQKRMARSGGEKSSNTVQNPPRKSALKATTPKKTPMTTKTAAESATTKAKKPTTTAATKASTKSTTNVSTGSSTIDEVLPKRLAAFKNNTLGRMGLSSTHHVGAVDPKAAAAKDWWSMKTLESYLALLVEKIGLSSYFGMHTSSSSSSTKFAKSDKKQTTEPSNENSQSRHTVNDETRAALLATILEKSKRTPLGISTELYNSAMLWLTGRHEDFVSDSKLSIEQWRNKYFEKSSAALMLSLWIADDHTSDAADHDVQWNFRYAGMTSQPMHLALGFRQGFDRVEGVRLPRDLGIYIKSALGNVSSLADLLQSNPDAPSFSLNGASSMSSSSSSSSSFSVEAEASTRGEQQILTDDANAKIREVDWLAVFARLDEWGRVLDHNGLAAMDLEPLVRAGLNISRSSLASSVSSDYDHFPTLVASVATKLVNLNTSLQENECEAALAHYFPVMQYVTAHFGMLETGVGVLEDVRISSSDFLGHHGEEDELHVFNENEAQAGDAEAQMWLGKRHFWGMGGVDPNPVIARRYFENAAAQGNVEGLYNLGVFAANGQAGAPQNQENALDYFLRAANPVDPNQQPFAMALHAVGQHFMSSGKHQNISLAKEYFLRAANLHSADGHFAYAMLLREGHDGNEIDVPMIVHHLAEAITLGHVRSANFLAHGLADPESWLAQYGRQEEARERARASFILEHPGEEFPQKLKEANDSSSSSSSSSTSNNNISNVSFIYPQWKYNKSEAITITLPLEIVVLPKQLGRGSPCVPALQLMKYVSSFSARCNDITRAALDAYLDGNLWLALELYDEAADLGVPSAQENAAFLYEELSKRECASSSHTSASKMIQQLVSSLTIPKTTTDASSTNKSTNSSSNVPLLPILADESKCSHYFAKQAARRWTQLANSGDFLAKREIADRIYAGKEPFERNLTHAALLYTFAAEQGDVVSLMSLGWVFGLGGPGVSKNRTCAKSLFTTAEIWENDMPANAYGFSPVSTNGVAPLIAQLYLRIDEFFVQCGLGGIQKLQLAFEALFKEGGTSRLSFDEDWMLIFLFIFLFFFFLGLLLVRGHPAL